MTDMIAMQAAYNAGVVAVSQCAWSDPDLPLAADAETEREFGRAWGRWWEEQLPSLEALQVPFAMIAFRAGFLGEEPPWDGGPDPRLEPLFYDWDEEEDEV